MCMMGSSVEVAGCGADMDSLVSIVSSSSSSEDTSVDSGWKSEVSNGMWFE